jgi:hypothetical protein
MSKPHKARRVAYRVRRCAEGWLPVVLIGEAPWVMAALPSKREASDRAKREAARIKGPA